MKKSFFESKSIGDEDEFDVYDSPDDKKPLKNSPSAPKINIKKPLTEVKSSPKEYLFLFKILGKNLEHHLIQYLVHY